MSAITVTESKEYMGVTVSTDDTLIQTLINLATAEVEDYTGKKIEYTVVSGERLVLNRPDFDYAPFGYFDLRGYRKSAILKNNPISGLTITYAGDTLVSSENYVVYSDIGYVAFLGGVDDSEGTLLASYQTGYGTALPSGLKSVVLDMVAKKYKTHGSIKGEGEVKSKGLGEFSVSFKDRDVDISDYSYILNKYRSYDI